MAQKKYETWFEQNVLTDVSEVESIGLLAIRSADNLFNLKLRKPQLVITWFGVVYEEICKELINMRNNDFLDYHVTICGRIEFGYSAGIDSDHEKQGNLCPYIKHLYKQVKADKPDSTTTLQNCVKWNSLNNTTDIDYVSKVVTNSFNRLRNEFEIFIEREELVMPVFITVYESLISFMRIRRAEMKEYEYSLQFANCFEITIIQNDEADDDQSLAGDITDIITITPSVSLKLDIKDDGKMFTHTD